TTRPHVNESVDRVFTLLRNAMRRDNLYIVLLLFSSFDLICIFTNILFDSVPPHHPTSLSPYLGIPVPPYPSLRDTIFSSSMRSSGQRYLAIFTAPKPGSRNYAEIAQR